MPFGRKHRTVVSSTLAITAASFALACGGSMAFSGQSPITVQGDLPAPPVEEPKPRPRVEVRDNKIEIHEKIQFEYAKADIKPESHSLLNEIVDVIQKNPHIKKIRIEGHASSEGDADFNRRLSDSRAKAVMKYLVDHGIPKDSLTAKGYGVDRPIATNDTEAGREKNRRVEFNIVEQDITQKKVEVDPESGEEKVLETKVETASSSEQPPNPANLKRPKKQ